MWLPLGGLDLVVERLRREAGHACAPSAASSAAWSRNAHDCGVQPRAPGIASQPGHIGRPGRAARG